MALREISGSSSPSVSEAGESSICSKYTPFIGQVFICSLEKKSVQLKHSPFSRFTAISVAESRFRCYARAGAARVDNRPVRVSGFVGVRKDDALAGGERAGMSSVIARCCSYVRARAMASSKVVGFSNSTSMHRGLCGPVVKMLIWCFLARSSQRVSNVRNLPWYSATVPPQRS
jgi:hypothetical protein